MSTQTSAGATVLTVGLDRDTAAVVEASCAHREPLTVVPLADASVARRWLADQSEPGERIVVLAAFREEDAWGLSTLFSRVRSHHDVRRAEFVLLSDLPVATLPVLITDVRGLRTVPPGSTVELRAHLDDALAEPASAAAS